MEDFDRTQQLARFAFQHAAASRHDDPQPRRPRWINDWLTWGTRAIIVGMCSLAYQQAKQIESTLQETQATLQSTQITIAKMSVQQDNQTQQLNQHAAQIERIWQEIRRQ